MNKATKKRIVNYVIAPLLLILFLWLIYRQINSKGSVEQQWHDLANRWHEGGWLLIAFAFILTPANWLLEARKWHLLLKAIEPLPYRTALSSTMTGMAFALVTPNKIGDFAGRILYIKDENKLRAIIATLIDNISQTVITYLAGIVGLIYLNIVYPGKWQMGALAVAICIATLLLYFYFRIELLANWAENRRWLRKVSVAIRVVKRYRKKRLLMMLLLSLLRFSCYSVQFVVFLKVFDLPVSWGAAWLSSCVMFWLITVVPSIFAVDLGVRAYVANLVFVDAGLVENSIIIIASSYIVWLLNWALAAIIGSLLLLTVRIFK